MVGYVLTAFVTTILLLAFLPHLFPQVMTEGLDPMTFQSTIGCDQKRHDTLTVAQPY